MPRHFRGPIIACYRDERGCVVLTQADQLPLEPQRRPQEWLWFTWGDHIPIANPRLATPDFIEALTQVVKDAAHTYEAKTGRPPRYLTIQTPGRILGQSYHLQGDGSFGRLAGLTVLMDTRLHLGEFGLAADLGSASAPDNQQESAGASAPPSASPGASQPRGSGRRERNNLAYPDDWERIANEVKDAAGWRCQNPRCQHPHDPAAGYTLTVHHRDGNPMNNAPENTVALCQRCHMVYCARQHNYGPEDDRQLRLW
jgi:hypothetical protein